MSREAVLALTKTVNYRLLASNTGSDVKWNATLTSVPHATDSYQRTTDTLPTKQTSKDTDHPLTTGTIRRL